MYAILLNTETDELFLWVWNNPRNKGTHKNGNLHVKSIMSENVKRLTDFNFTVIKHNLFVYLFYDT